MVYNNLCAHYMNIHLHPDELIFHKVGDEIVSAGFGINSVLLNKGLPPILSFSTKESDESEVENPSIFKSFKNLAVPLGLFTKTLQQQQQHKKEEEAEHKGTLPDSIYDKLMQMADFDKPEKPKSKKHRNKYNNKSMRKHNKK